MSDIGIRRSLGIDRTYVLGSYKNLKVTGIISQIPQHILLNPEAMKALASMLWAGHDAIYYDYIKRSPTVVDGITSEEAQVILEEVREESFEKIMKAVEGESKKNKEEVEEKYGEDYLDEMENK